MTTLLNELRNNLVTANELGDAEWAAALEARIADEEKAQEDAADLESKPLASMTKAELVAVAESRGYDASGLTKTEILEALEEEG